MKRCIALSVFAVLIILICCLTCFLAPAYARTLNTQVWTGQIDPPIESGQPVISDLLAEEGQTVLLKRKDGIFRVSFTLTSETEDVISGAVSVTNNDPEWLSVVSGAQDIELTGGGTVTVTIEMESLIPVEAEPEGPEEPGESEEPGAPEEESEIPDNVTFSVTFESEDITLEAVFSMETEEYDIMPADEYTGLLNGTITEITKWYGKDIPIYITLDGAARIKYYEGEDTPGEFPPMTRYSVDEDRTVLYDGGYIIVGSSGTVRLDFSDTDVGEDIGFNTDSSDFQTEEEALPQWKTRLPIVLDDTAKAVLNTYTMENTTPDITVERLVRDENSVLTWEETYLVICTENSDGEAVLNAYEAPAGTYRIIFEWSYRGRTLYKTERNFFIVYSSGWQGGISR